MKPLSAETMEIIVVALVVSGLWMIIGAAFFGKMKQARFKAESQNQILTSALDHECEKANELSREISHLQRTAERLSIEGSTAKEQAAGLRGQLMQIDSLNLRIREKDLQLAKLQTVQNENEARMAEISARADNDAKHHAAQIEMLTENKELLKKEFSLLANSIFEQKNQQFSQQSEQSISALLNPFQKQIDQFRQRVDDIHVKDAEGRTQLLTQLTMLRDTNALLNKQAGDLTKALKGDKKLQGNWGELQIERILESAGLQKGREYEREPNYKDDEGNNRRPDFIIRLPEGKHIIVDSKVSLNAYQMALNADDDASRAAAMRHHVSSTRNHIRSLSQKDYPSLHGLNAPDFVLMFMPIESAFVAAFEAEPQLFNEAFEQNIVVVTPTTLLATLRTIGNLWVLERQNENAKQLFNIAAKIHDKLAVFGAKMDRLGGQLDTAGKTWHDAMGSIRDGRGSMASYVQRLKDLGAPASKKLPESLATKELLESDEAAPDTD